MKYWITVAILLVSLAGFSQVNDNFSDGNFTNNPEWTGETTKFTVNNEELQLYDNAKTGTAYLSTQNTAINDAVWEFLVRFDFNPSSSNYAKVYLCSDNANLNESLNGYFVKLGSADDEISLYRQNGNTESEIIDGIDDRLNLNDVNVRVRATRDATGNWTLESDTLGGTNYMQEGSVFDDTHISSFYLGVNCAFTSSRWDKMFFDDFSVTGNPYIDNIPPEFQSYEIISDTKIVLNFSEPMEAISSLNVSNYQLSGGLGNPASAEYYNGNQTQIQLTLSNAIMPNTAYSLAYQGLKDLAGNEIVSSSFEFSIVEVQPYDIVFNEIMADPSPTVNLPDAEYIELFNRKNVPISLDGWKLMIGNSEKNLPIVNIPADGYVIICHNSNETALSSYGQIASITESFSLTNSGKTLTLKSADDIIIDKVSYTDDWYQDPNKDEGGWSLERIDPENHCSGKSNWSASINENGGTPGSINSIDADNVDTEAPAVLSWEISSGNEIALKMSEEVDTLSLSNLSNFYLAPDYGEPLSVSLDENNPLIIHVQFVAEFQEGVLYEFSLQNLSDECGNIMADTSFTFINYTAQTFDVLISEIMTDPSPEVYLPNAEYIELKNMTDYAINLSGWTFISGSTSVSLPASEIPIGGQVALVDIDDYQSFTGMDNIVPVNNMPSLKNASGELQLLNQKGNLIHFVNYSDTWYHSDVKKEGGWSLEMIDAQNPCGTEDNWTASVSETGGTPGAVNSVAENNPDETIPDVLKAIIHQPDTVMLYFTESLHPEWLSDSSRYTIDNGIGEAIFATRPQGMQNALKLAFSNAFQAKTIYTLTISDNVQDCAGNIIEENTQVRLAIADTAEFNDVVINEVLFNPYSGAADYVELYNRSEKFINLSELRMATKNDSLMIDNVKLITKTGHLLFPGEFVVLSEGIQSVKDNYYCKKPEYLLGVSDLPSYGDKSGDVVLCLPNLKVIDEMHYDEKMHFQLLKDLNGVSLERIDYNRPSAEKDNWHSASETVGFGTPTYENSQFQTSQNSESMFELSSKSISPDNDGFEDFLSIRYTMNQPGYMMNINIYDAAGHFVRKLVDNEMLGTEGSFRWDGLDENQQHPGAGIYIILLDYFDLNGKRHQEKYTCVIAVKNG